MASETVKDSEQPDSPTVPTPVYAHGGRGDGEGEGSVAADAQNDNASSVDQAEEKTPPVVLNKKQKFKRHCGRFKWWYLVAGIILLAIILPILFKVIVPVIVQSIIKSQKLPINSGSIRAVSPTEIEFTLSTSLDSPLPAKIDAMDLSLFNKDTPDYSPFLTLGLPKSSVSKNTEIHVTKQMVTVENHTELVSWFNDIFDLPEAEVSVNGKPVVHLSSLTYKPTLKKTIKLPALNYLEGFGIIDLSFMIPAAEDGTNMKGHLNLPNAGILTLDLGNLTLNMLSGDAKLGLVNVYNVALKPGNNSFDFDGEFYFKELVPNLATILDSQKDALGNGYIELNATGNATVVNGQHIKYVEEVLNKKTLRATIPVITLLTDVIGGVLNGDSSSVYSLVGEVFGNSTLLEKALGHFDSDGRLKNETDTKRDLEGDAEARKKLKRTNPGSSLMWNMLKMGLKSKKR